MSRSAASIASIAAGVAKGFSTGNKWLPSSIAMRPLASFSVIAMPIRFAEKLLAWEKTKSMKSAGQGRAGLQIRRSSGVRIFLSGLARVPSTISGTLVFSPFHIGLSMLSNTSRSLWPQLLCII